MLKSILGAALVAMAVTPALAQDDEKASDQDLASVTEAIARIGCQPGPEGVEKERADLYEVDDAQCEIGQYDIKLSGDFHHHQHDP
ncbi:hypothetical protein [Paracoccus shandongensis]|uniref:hypothetical protein n=1 Tax=Paracoccus shandongensis TaxID=2816048 RepID=UPI001A8ED404|nr:hypothetical protein [Paracoccus shandongensis]